MDDERISIGVDVDTGDSAVALAEISRELKGTGREASRAKPKVDSYEQALERAAEASRTAATRAKAAERRIKELGREATKSAAKIKLLEREIDKLNKKMSKLSTNRGGPGVPGGAAPGGGGRGGSGGSSGRSGNRGGMRGSKGIFGGVAGGSIIAMMSKFGTIAYFIAGVLPALLTAVASLGAGILGLTGALAPLAGLLIAYPGYLAAVAQGFAAVKLGMAGISDAMKDWSDTSKTLQEANQGIARFTGGGINKDIAKPFISALSVMRSQFTYVGYAVQRTFLPQMTQLKGVMQELMPSITRGLIGSGMVIGNIISNLGSFLKQGRTQSLIDSIIGTNTDVIARFGVMLKPIVSMVLELVNAAGPMLRQLAGDVAGFFSKVSSNVSSNAEGGGLAKFFQSAYEAARRVMAIIGPLVQGIWNIAKIGKPLGDAILGSWGAMASKFLEFTKSADGVNKITEWFKFMTPILYEVGYLIRDIAVAIGTLSMKSGFMELSMTIRKELLPVLVEFIQSTADQLLPVLIEATEAVLKLLTAWQGASATIMIIKALTGLLDILVLAIEKTNGVVTFLISLFFALWATIKIGKFVMPLFVAIKSGIDSLRVAALLGAGGFRALAASIRGALLSTGVGALLVVVGLVAEAIMSSNSAIDDAIAKNQAWADSIFEVNGALSEQAVITTAQSLKDTDAYKFAEILGISGDTIVRAAMNDVKALETVRKAYDDIISTYDKRLEAAKTPAAKGAVAQAMAADPMYQSAKGLLEIIDPMAVAFVDEAKAAEYAAKAGGTWGKSLDEINGTAVGATDSIDGIASASLEAAKAMERMNRALQNLNGLLSRRERRRQYQEDIDSLRKSLKDNGAIFGFGTKKGRENLAAVDSIIKTSTERADEFIKANNKPAALKALQQGARDVRRVFVDVFGKDKGRQYADQVLGPLNTEIASAKKGLRDVITAEAADTQGYGGGRYVGSTWVPAAPQPVTGPTVPAAAPQATGGQYVGSTFVPTAAGAVTAPTPEPVTKYTLEVDAASLKNAETSSNVLKQNMIWFQTPPHVLVFTASGLSQAVSDARILKTTLEAMAAQKYQTTLEIKTKLNGGGRRADGGPVLAGLSYLVGERGPEAFISASGVSIIGENGMEHRTFAESGYVVPNHELAGVLAGQAKEAPARGNSEQSHGGDINVHIGTIQQATEFDVTVAVKKAILEAERNRRERS